MLSGNLGEIMVIRHGMEEAEKMETAEIRLSAATIISYVRYTK